MATNAASVATTGTSKAPWHLWVVGALALLWNSFGAFDYFMSKTRGDEYLRSAGMTPEQITYYHAMPAWMTAVWAIGVWGALLGAALLLARSRYATPVFVASLLAFVLSVVHQYLIATAMPGTGPATYAMQAVIFVSCVAFAAYARRATARGWLR